MVSASSIMTTDELDVCGCDSVVSDETGEVVSVDYVDDVVACGDDPLLPDVVRLGGRLSVVGDTLVCGAGVARSDRGDTEAVVGSGVAQRGWVDRLMCADDSLRPEPPPMYSMCLCRSLLAAACYLSGHGDFLCLEYCMYRSTTGGLPVQILICII